MAAPGPGPNAASPLGPTTLTPTLLLTLLPPLPACTFVLTLLCSCPAVAATRNYKPGGLNQHIGMILCFRSIAIGHGSMGLILAVGRAVLLLEAPGENAPVNLFQLPEAPAFLLGQWSLHLQSISFLLSDPCPLVTLHPAPLFPYRIGLLGLLEHSVTNWVA